MSIKKNLKSFSSVLAFIIICFSLSSSSAFAQFAGGDGGMATPYQITNCTQLQAIGDTAAEVPLYGGKSFILINDIDCSATLTWNEDWYSDEPRPYLGFDPIDNFTGSLDGQGYSITDLYIDRPNDEYVGIFSSTTNNAFSNLNLENINITGSSYVGGLVGKITDGTLNNISVGGTLSASSFVGGIAGQLYNDVQPKNTVDDCHFTGNISGGYGVGGLFGTYSAFGLGNTVNITNSSSSGFITSEDYSPSARHGGLFGSNEGINISDCHSTMNVSGEQDIGGLIGQSFGGNITNSYTSDSTISTSGISVGGLVGYNQSSGTILNSYSSSTIISTGYNNAGGLVGVNKGLIDNCHFTGSVSGAGDYIGGLVGGNSGSIINSYSTANVTGTDVSMYVGGLIGDNKYDSMIEENGINSGRVLNSYASGNIIGNSSFSGGLIGQNSKSHIENCYSTGEVQVGSYSGGLIGANVNLASSAKTVKNCYSTSNVTGTGSFLGGLIGINFTDLVVNSYSTGSVSSSAVGATAVGGFIGTLQYDGNIGSTDSADRYSSNNGWLKSDGLSAIGEIASYEISDYDTISTYQGPGSVTHEETDASVFYSKDHDIYDFGGVNAWDFITPIWYEWTNTFPKFEAQAAEPTSTSAPTNNNSGSGSNPGSPLFESCHDPKPTGISDLFQIDTASTNAKLFFTPIVDADRYYISFSSVNPNSAEEHGELVTLTKEGVQSHTVYKLKPNTVYYVKVRGQRGCMPGDWSTILKIKTTSNNSNIVSYYKYSKTGLSTIINKTKNVVKTKISASTSETTLPNSTVTPVPTAEVTPKVETKKTTTESTSTESTSTESTSTESTTPSNKKCFLWWCW
ncbi:MAG: GLUG motif-containing protein [Candidatus Shapirobacteria bacterium]|nr:GLUG motif-containing protein [Candidatus Shapirobacteria bacterium]